MANELGCPDEFSGLEFVVASNLSIDYCRELFEKRLRMKPMFGGGWRFVWIEEMELIPSKAVAAYLKVALDRNQLPPRTTVVACSNNPEQIPDILLGRFKPLLNFDGGPNFKDTANDWLAKTWGKLFGNQPMPFGWQDWGVYDDGFSLRTAMTQFEDAIAEMQLEVA